MESGRAAVDFPNATWSGDISVYPSRMAQDGECGTGLGDRLKGPGRAVWAKHDRDTEGWLPLWRHMEDSAAVAGLLWDRWLPANLRTLISATLPGGEGDGRRLAVWLAGVHDIGKATPAIAGQLISSRT